MVALCGGREVVASTTPAWKAPLLGAEASGRIPSSRFKEEG